MTTPHRSGDAAYTREVLRLGPAGYWKLDETGGTTAHDSSGNGRDGTYRGDPSLGVPGVVGPRAVLLNGVDQYVEIPDDDAWSQPTTGAITVVAWMRPDSLSMPVQEGTGYVHWLGKGEPHQQEWTFRMYQAGNSEGRDNRISFYAFNLDGHLGNGSYFQDAVIPGEWLMVAGLINATEVSIFKDGLRRDRDPLDQSATGGPVITPRNGTAPVRLGTRDLSSFFQGALAEVAIFPRELSDTDLAALWSSAQP